MRAVCLARALGRGSLGSSPQEGGSRDEGGRVEDAGSGSRRWAEEEWRWRARGRRGLRRTGRLEPAALDWCLVWGAARWRGPWRAVRARNALRAFADQTTRAWASGPRPAHGRRHRPSPRPPRRAERRNCRRFGALSRTLIANSCPGKGFAPVLFAHNENQIPRWFSRAGLAASRRGAPP